MKIDDKKSELLRWIEENKADFLKLERQIWEKPELSMEETQASGWVCALLKKYGFDVELGVAGMPTAFVASWGMGKPVLGFTAEYDALPGLSQKKESYEKDPIREGGPGHGCGHNLLAAGGVLAAIALKELLFKSGETATIKVFGTPGEEIMIGKPFMAKAGCFQGVDVFLDWHGYSGNVADASFNNGYFNLRYYFKGKTSHGNAPWFGRSTLDATMLTAHAIEMLREHLPPGEKGAETTINYALPDVGNSFPNVVPDKTTLWVVGRGNRVALLKEMMERLQSCAKGCAEATGTEVSCEVVTAVPNMLYNESIAKVVNKNLKFVGAPHFTEKEQDEAKRIQGLARIPETGYHGEIAEYKISGMAATDSSQLSWIAPYAVAQIQLTPSDALGWHNWIVTKFAGSTQGEKVMTAAAGVLATSALELIYNPEIVEEAKREHVDRVKVQGFFDSILLPKDGIPPIHINKEAMEKFR